MFPKNTFEIPLRMLTLPFRDGISRVNFQGPGGAKGLEELFLPYHCSILFIYLFSPKELQVK